MTKSRRVSSATALGSLTAAVALLAGLSQANAQAPTPAPPLSGAGSFPQSFIVPGTNTSLHVGGFIQLDTNYDMSASGNSGSPGAHDNLNPNSVELEGNGFAVNPAGHTDHGTFRATAQNTRFSVETRTPSAYGEIKTYIEIDFAGNQSTYPGAGGSSVGGSQTNFNFTSVARIKQAYGTLGPWLFGMANSNYADLAALPDTLDGFVEAGGFMGAGTAKVPQVRYTYLLPMGITASASLESNQTGGIIASSTGATPVTTNNFNSPFISQKFPAVTTTVQIQQPWGHAGFHVAVAEARLKDFGVNGFPPAIAVGDHVEKWGYMLSQTGHFNTIGKDKITWMLSYGQGASNYTWALNELGTQWEEDLVCSGNAATVAASTGVVCSQPRVMGVNVGYSHWWTNEWRTGIAFGYDQVSRPNAAGPWSVTGGGGLTALERKHYSAGVDMFWTPVAGVQFGFGYLWYHRTVWSGAHGSANRVVGQALFAF
jgi:hypothetical protein